MYFIAFKLASMDASPLDCAQSAPGEGQATRYCLKMVLLLTQLLLNNALPMPGQ